MKIHKGMVNARVLTQVVKHYQHSVRQSPNATATTPAIGAPRALDVRAGNAVVVRYNEARTVKRLKSGIRRISYK